MGNQNKQDSQKPRNFWGGCFTIFLFIAVLIVLLLLLNAQIDLNYAKGKYSAALETISDKNEEISSLESEVKSSNSRVRELNSKIDSLRSEIDSLNAKISSAGEEKISLVAVTNNNCNNSFVFVDGRLAAGTRANGNTYFYVPYGKYDVQVCTEPSRTSCGEKSNREINMQVYPLTITKHSSCP